MTVVFETAAQLWRDRTAASREYSVVRNDRVSRAFLSRSPLPESEYRAALAYRASLIRQYADRTLEEVFPGRHVGTPEGEVYCITRGHALRVPRWDRESFRRSLLSDLSLVRGIGKRTGEILRARGYRTIPDLLHHRRFSAPARECLRVLEEGTTGEVISLVARWYPSSHVRHLSSARLLDPADFLFLDIETLGIFQRPIILAGLARVEGSRLVTDQYLVCSMEEELPALLAARGALQGYRALVTYNGRSFDVPYLRERCALYGEAFSPCPIHYDLLHPVRRLFSERYPDCRLATLERGLLGITRWEDIPSMMVPEFYEAYVTHSNPGPLVPVVEHNCQDLVSLAMLFFSLLEAP
ncbi:MAG: ribonuclease H-like domain-containing protein [Methanolinea sp.]|nr:ribonuclease H-like domain-containing protein [Methanolinea sp.]